MALTGTLARVAAAEILFAAVEGGMRTLKMDGMEKVLMGLTDLKMVRSACIKQCFAPVLLPNSLRLVIAQAWGLGYRFPWDACPKSSSRPTVIDNNLTWAEKRLKMH